MTATTSRSAPRRLTAKGEATRARIVEAASALVFAHGVTRTGVEDVQREAGVSASQLYHYFGDKQTLMRAVIAHQTDAILVAQRPVLDELDSFAALEQWRDLLVDMQEQRHCAGGCPIGSIAAELAEDHPLARERDRRRGTADDGAADDAVVQAQLDVGASAVPFGADAPDDAGFLEHPEVVR